MTTLTLLLVVIATLAIFATTQQGRSLLKRTALRDRIPGAAPREDVAFLLRACGGDRAEVERRLEAERARLPDLTEAEHYRRAIRKAMAEGGASSARGD